MPRLATIIICLFLSLLLGFFLLWPKYQQFRDLQWKIKEKEIEIHDQEKYFSQLNDISEKLKEYTPEFSKIGSALPSDLEPSLPALLDFLQKTSATNGLIFKKVTSFLIVSPKEPSATPSSPEKEETTVSQLKEINIDFEISGSYSALKYFLSVLEKSARIINIDLLSFSGKTGDSAKESLPSYNLKISTHSY